jgi:hypothetical protein
MIQTNPFAGVAAGARQGEILQLVIATMMFWLDVFDRGCGASFFRHDKLAIAVNALADPHPFATHIALGKRVVAPHDGEDQLTLIRWSRFFRHRRLLNPVVSHKRVYCRTFPIITDSPGKRTRGPVRESMHQGSCESQRDACTSGSSAGATLDSQGGLRPEST